MSPVAPPRLRKVIRVVALVHGGPGVCGLHRERPVYGAHHEPLPRFELHGSVDVGEPAAHEPGDEFISEPTRSGGSVFQVTDSMFCVPLGRVVRVGGVGGDLGAGAGDRDLGQDVDSHRRRSSGVSVG